MARPIRLDYPDTFYHILSRGNERKEIFRDREDYQQFTHILGKMVEKFRVEIHVYILMSNHYHLMIRTREANLSRASNELFDVVQQAPCEKRTSVPGAFQKFCRG